MEAAGLENQSEEPTSQGLPAAGRGWKMQARTFPESLPGERRPAGTWGSDFSPPECERLHFHFEPPGFGNLFTEALRNGNKLGVFQNSIYLTAII